jgi:antibiotic biosynthesis monooxygenase
MTTGFLAEPWHRHDHRCYWDHTRCGWVCPAEEVTEAETHLSEQPLDRPGSAAEPHRERVQSISDDRRYAGQIVGGRGQEALSRLWTVTEPGIPLLMNVTLTIRPERLDAFTAALREVLAHARAEDACLHLDVGRSVADPGVFVLSEAGVTSSSTATSSSRRTFSSSTCRAAQTPTPNPGS